MLTVALLLLPLLPVPSTPRRKPKENNFKAVLESIRDLMNEELIIPQWLHDIFLGYGDPGAAHYTGMEPTLRLQSVDCKDTFLDAEHLRDSFPQYEVRRRRMVWGGSVQGRVEAEDGVVDWAGAGGECLGEIQVGTVPC